jgi:hypothetical protein
MFKDYPILAQAEAIVREAKRDDMERTVRACEESNDATLRSLARAYRMLSFGS